jgi:hypothetical protein
MDQSFGASTMKNVESGGYAAIFPLRDPGTAGRTTVYHFFYRSRAPRGMLKPSEIHSEL